MDDFVPTKHGASTIVLIALNWNLSWSSLQFLQLFPDRLQYTFVKQQYLVIQRWFWIFVLLANLTSGAFHQSIVFFPSYSTVEMHTKVLDVFSLRKWCIIKYYRQACFSFECEGDLSGLGLIFSYTPRAEPVCLSEICRVFVNCKNNSRDRMVDGWDICRVQQIENGSQYTILRYTGVNKV